MIEENDVSLGNDVDIEMAEGNLDISNNSRGLEFFYLGFDLEFFFLSILFYKVA